MKKILGLILAAGAAFGVTVFTETESFADKGGWVVDQQFMDLMGSPFLMAHGMGVPVKDAVTTVQIPEDGEYRLFARTRNWVEAWNKTEAPGRFKIALNGQALPVEFGIGGGKWHWQDGGKIALKKGSATLALKDLTGFNGRCDAIVLTTETAPLPNEIADLTALRLKVGAITPAKEGQRFDLVICGAGVPGICAAISAARLGLNVALINDRPVLGGNNSSEIRVHLGGRVNVGPYPKLGDIVNEIGPAKGGNAQPAARYEDERKLAAVQAEKNITLFVSTRVLGVQVEGKTIKSVTAQNIENGKQYLFESPLFLDNTGDGTIGALAGAEFRYGRESKAETGEETAVEVADKQTMGSSVQWYSVVTPDKKPSAFPDIRWGLAFDDAKCEKVTMGEWTWETGMNKCQISDFEAIRDYGMLVVFSNWSYLKNHLSAADSAKFAPRQLSWVAYVAGKRESRRLIGDHVLTETDFDKRTPYPDGTCCATWTIDLHYPDPKNTANFPGAEFKSISTHKKIYPYPIPYRCYYSKNIENLFMAGRNISTTHVALGTTRLIRTGGMMGEVVGMAASICKKHGCAPRGVYEKHLDELKALMARGVGDGKTHPPQKYNQGQMLLD